MNMTPTQRTEFARGFSELAAVLRKAAGAAERVAAVASSKGFTGMNKAGVKRTPISYRPMGTMKVTQPVIYCGVDITDIDDPHTRTAVQRALDICEWRGVVDEFAGVKCSTVKASSNAAAGKWFAAARPSDRSIRFTEYMKSLGASDSLDVALHELAHLYLLHGEQPRKTPADEAELERQADVLAVQWRWG